MKDVISVILGGGRGTRLFPLTKYRAKPAVPIAGKYRLVDIPISNCLNSGLNRIVILTQFNSASLNRHIYQAYKMDGFSHGYVNILAADQAMDHGDWFQGSADAVRKCMRHFSDPRLKYFLILSGDQLYTMDLGALLEFHRDRRSEITVACNPVDKKDTPELGIAHIDDDFRIRKFIEKPSRGRDIGSIAVRMQKKDKYLASMGIYVFSKDTLFDLLQQSKKIDFGKEIIPDALNTRVTRAYVHNGYWKDIGSIKAFYEENLALTGRNPPLNFYDENWPFYTRPRYLPLSRVIASSIEGSMIAEGTIIEQSKIRHSVIGLRSIVGSNSTVEDSVVMGNDYYEKDIPFSGGPTRSARRHPHLGIGRNCRIRRAIVDKNVCIGNNVKITNRAGHAQFENEYCVIRNGITIIPKGTVIPSGTVI
ncbi:MAG: glucose-1-phosphate adenylyltransferase [Candidatus Omnitrophica bacterium]|nr:glucose-1-phosphate adenylyltransferase [Candidatus Omnitrophota bacterium]